MKLENILAEVHAIKKNNGLYYSINHFQKVIKQNINKHIEVVDTIITPFYICDSGILEIYDFELNIRLVDIPQSDTFLLTQTGMSSIEDIEINIKEKLLKCYIEIVNPQRSLPITRINEYISYVITATEIRERVGENVESYNNQNLYFEVY